MLWLMEIGKQKNQLKLPKRSTKAQIGLLVFELFVPFVEAPDQEALGPKCESMRF